MMHISGDPRWRGVLLAVVMAVVLMVLLVACTGAVPTTQEASGEVAQRTAAATQDTAGDQATLIVQLDDDRTLVRKLDLTAPISGLALLEQSDLDVVKADFSWGTAVCSIEGVGCPAEDCFCSENTFWNYLSWHD